MPNRPISVHPREKLLQQARVRQQGDAGRRTGALRTGVEHAIARLCQRGIRKSRFFGRKRTWFQLLLAAAVVNLTLVEGGSWKGRSPGTDPGPEPEPRPAAGPEAFGPALARSCDREPEGRAAVTGRAANPDAALATIDHAVAVTCAAIGGYDLVTAIEYGAAHHQPALITSSPCFAACPR